MGHRAAFSKAIPIELVPSDRSAGTAHESDLNENKFARADAPVGSRSNMRLDSWLVGIAIVVTLGTLLRLTRLRTGLWFDEGITWDITNASTFGSLLNILANVHGSERLAPLHPCLVYFWRALFGDSEVSLRLLSILMSIASVLLLADASRRLFGRSAALWAAAIGGSSAYLVAYGGYIRPYATVILCTCIVVDAWAADCTSDHRRTGPIVWCAVGAVALTAGIAFSFIPLTMMALCDWRLRSDWRRWLLLWGPSAALSIPVGLGVYGGWIFWGTNLSVPGRQGILISLMFAIYGIAVGETYGPTVQALHGAHLIDVVLRYWLRLMLFAGVLLALTINIVRILSRPGGRTGDEVPRLALRSLVFALVGSLLIGAVAGYLGNLNWLPRHAFFAAPIFVLILAALPTLDASAIVGATPIVALLLMNLISIVNMDCRREYALDDYADVARYLNSPEVRESSRVMVYGVVPLMRNYYHVSGLIDGSSAGPHGLGPSLDSLTGRASDVTLVVDRQWAWAGENLVSVQAHCYEVREHERFPYFDLYRMTRDESCP